MVRRLRCRRAKNYKAVRRSQCGCLWCWLKYKLNHLGSSKHRVTRRRTRTKKQPETTNSTVAGA